MYVGFILCLKLDENAPISNMLANQRLLPKELIFAVFLTILLTRSADANSLANKISQKVFF